MASQVMQFRQVLLLPRAACQCVSALKLPFSYFRPHFPVFSRAISSRMSSEIKHSVSETGVEFPSLEKALPLDKFQSTYPERRPIVLVACGSYSPITFLHLRLFEIAKDHFMTEDDKFDVIGGIVSPVHDLYGKKGLVSSEHRLEMCRLGTASSKWISVSSWEVDRNRWSRTHEVLNAYSEYLNEALKGKYAFPIGLKLLCGADILESCLDQNVWPLSDIKSIFGKYGVVCIERQGHNSSDLIHEKELLYQYRNTIHLVPQRISNNISSTAVRRLLARSQSIKYLAPDSVVDYIEANKLYKEPK